MGQASNIALRKYIDILHRKKYLLAWLLLLSLPIGLTVYLQTEKIHPAVARIATDSEDEVTAAKEAMDRQDQAMRDYKRAHSDEMPDQRPENVQKIVALQERYRKNEDAILTAQKTKTLWQEQAKALRRAPSADESAARIDPLERARNHLRELRQKYTENHPEVKRLVAEIKQLEPAPPDAPAGEPLKVMNAATARQTAMRYETQIENYNMQIGMMTKENEGIIKQIEQLQKWMDTASVREAEWSSLVRDYAVLKERYDKLAEKKFEAHQQQTQTGQSKIENSPSVPETSFKSDFHKIMGVSVLLAVALCAVLVILSAFSDQSFRIPADIENFLQLPVVSVVVSIPTVREKKRASIFFLVKALILSFAGMLVLGYFAWAWSTGKIVI
ncbi:MAG TPA: hypothetical protein DEB25_00385 [Desulfobulbaceae bacterium]|nr:hypothetical protein [Desulfobulbaceae bacterium]